MLTTSALKSALRNSPYENVRPEPKRKLATEVTVRNGCGGGEA